MDLDGVAGNDVSKSNVPDIRVAFRNELYKAERSFLATGVTMEESLRFNPDISATCTSLEKAMLADLE